MDLRAWLLLPALLGLTLILLRIFAQLATLPVLLA